MIDPPEQKQDSLVIHCPNCGRLLRALRVPRCNWCGVPVSAEDFAAIAEQSQRVMSLPDPPPLPPVTSVAQRAEWGGRWRPKLFPLLDLPSSRPVTPGQSRLRRTVLYLLGALAVAKLGDTLYAIWIVHHLIPMPH